ncbi:MAG: hypothetical protein KatS3mg131_0307 [Candidatus Tectimicrobiota bacterium]|nr:MAG: hypothetical protein KatS3mg131_0307 [Candidatus Tectomicrobia bacterium]
MKMEEIRKRYKGEWVLIAFTELDAELQVVEGEVIAHAKDRDAIYKAQAKMQDKQLAIEYLGEIPEEGDIVTIF